MLRDDHLRLEAAQVVFITLRSLIFHLDAMTALPNSFHFLRMHEK